MNTQHNVFGDRICDKSCPAFVDHPRYGIFCDAKLEYQGRVKPVDSDGVIVVQYGMLCRIPGKYKLVKKNIFGGGY